MAEQKTNNNAPIRVSRKLVILSRLVVALVFAVWVAGIFYFHSRMQATEQEILQLRQRKQQEEERLRREASYRRAVMERQAVQSGVQNAVDAFK